MGSIVVTPESEFQALCDVDVTVYDVILNFKAAEIVTRQSAATAQTMYDIVAAGAGFDQR